MANVGGNVGGNFVAGNNNVVTFHGHALTPIDIAALNPGRALEVLLTMPIDNAVGVLATIDPKSAAAIFGLMDSDQVMTFAAPMHPDRLEPIRGHTQPAVSRHIRDVVAAVAAMTASTAVWRSRIGAPIGQIVPVGPSKRGTTGYRRDHERGAMYWNSRTGLGMVTATLVEIYEANGGVGGSLGFPIRSEKPSADSPLGTSGTFQRFEALSDYPDHLTPVLTAACGATIYRSTHGVCITAGPIGEYFEDHGGTAGRLGFPVEHAYPATDENGGPASSQQFEGGYVLLSGRAGAVAVAKDVVEAVRGDDTVGYPLAEEITATSPFGTEGRMQRFGSSDGEHDAIVVCRNGKDPIIVRGDISAYYQAHDGIAGLFGFPLDEAAVWHSADGGSGQLFEGGGIYASDRTPTVSLVGDVHEFEQTGDIQAMGWPTSEVCTIGAGPDVVQLFEHGVITIVDGVPRQWMAVAKKDTKP